MTSPAPSPANEDLTVPKARVRRSRLRWQLALSLLAVVGVAMTTSACTPEFVAKDAISRYWGGNSACAARIVDRESNFQADAVNRSSGTIGLFQIHPTHKAWVKRTFGYDFAELKDPAKNAKVAKGLSAEAYRAYRDGWQPWRIGGAIRPGGGCPA